jgi:hypothetical protein
MEAGICSAYNSATWNDPISSSFPLVLKTIPELSEWGAYSLHKVYTAADVKELVIQCFKNAGLDLTTHGPCRQRQYHAVRANILKIL